MKTNSILLLVILLAPMLWFGCAKETVEPEFTGSIEGRVQNSQTGEPVALASITTNPGTSAILTDTNGEFAFNDIPTGNYNIQVQKDDFESRSARVIVRENEITNAQILLTDENQDGGSNIVSAEVTSFFNTSSNDSMFVEVDYIVRNDSGSRDLDEFEVYFQIFTAEDNFFQEINGDSLEAGEQEIGSFIRYIRQFSADSVVVTGTFAPDDN